MYVLLQITQVFTQVQYLISTSKNFIYFSIFEFLVCFFMNILFEYFYILPMFYILFLYLFYIFLEDISSFLEGMFLNFLRRDSPTN